MAVTGQEYALGRAAFTSGILSTGAKRKAALEVLRRQLLLREPALAAALREDLGKSREESYMTETGLVLRELRELSRRVDRWMRPKRVPTPLALFPGRGEIRREPLGCVLILAPFNYPVQLLLLPLAAALAAGNTAVVKPSELAPASEQALRELLEASFPRELVRCVTGGPETAQELLRQPFDHVFFTGSGRVGKTVYQAASRHLTPVTLELGGKSPAIVTKTADLPVAARRLLWGKLLNAGQTCVAPDYALVDRKILEPLVWELRRALLEFYGPDPEKSPDFSRVISVRHWDRLKAILDRDREMLILGGDGDRESRYLAPAILLIPPERREDAACMDEELFGPILPLLPYETSEEAESVIRRHPNPLALYIFSRNRQETERFLRIPAGGACVNGTVEQLASPRLPFGGIGASGMGNYHGEAGLRTFSHEKSVLRKGRLLLPLSLPPVNEKKDRLIRRFLR